MIQGPRHAGDVDDSGKLELTEKRTTHTSDLAGFSPAGVAAMNAAVHQETISDASVARPTVPGGWRAITRDPGNRCQDLAHRRARAALPH